MLIFFFMLVFSFQLSLVAQTIEDDTIHQSPPFSMQINAGYGFSVSGIQSQGLFFSPSISKPINSSFSLKAGIVFQSLSLQMLHGDQQYSSSMLQTMSVYISGRHLLTDKLAISGGFSHTFPFQLQATSLTPYTSSTIFGGLDYKIGEKSWIGVQFSYSKGDYSPLLFNPGMGSGNSYFSPFLFE